MTTAACVEWGTALGVVRAVPDDGYGDLVRVELADEAALERVFSRSRWHRLRLRALPSRYGGGLCVYGRPTRPLPKSKRRALHTIRVTLAP